MITRLKLSTIEQGLPKYRSMLAGNDAFIPTSFESIATTTLSSPASFIEFSSIPGTYQHLQIRGIARDTYSADNAAWSGNLRLNGDTAANYAIHQLRGDGSSASAQGSANYGQPLIYDWQWGSTAANNIFGVSIIDIHDYASTSKNKTLRIFAGAEGNTGNTNSKISLQSALWRSTNAITTIRLIPFIEFATGTTFALYGIKGA